MPEEERIMDQAIDWTIRLRHGDRNEWQRFTGWLEADPAHLQAYERAAVLDGELGEILTRGQACERPLPKLAMPRRLVVGGAVAAALALSVFAWSTMNGSRDLYPVETAAGQRMALTLEGGSTIHVNGDSRLLLDRDDSRFAELVQGEALFSVRHDPSAPFEVDAGAVTVRNLGTIFDVRRDGTEVAVKVAKGAVMFSTTGLRLRLAQGESAQMTNGTVETGQVVPATVGGWREGQLSYGSASLAEVARDVSRASGIKVSVDPAIASHRFSGVIIVNGDRELVRRRLAALLDVKVELAPDGWVLAPKGP